MRSWPWWSACTGCAPKPVAWQLHQKVILLYNSCGEGPSFGVPSDRRCVRSTSLRQVDMARSTVGLTVDFCRRTRQRKGSLGSFTSVPHPRFVNHAYIYRSGSCGFSPSRSAVSFRASSRAPVHIVCRVVHCAQTVLRVNVKSVQRTHDACTAHPLVTNRVPTYFVSRRPRRAPPRKNVNFGSQLCIRFKFVGSI